MTISASDFQVRKSLPIPDWPFNRCCLTLSFAFLLRSCEGHSESSLTLRLLHTAMLLGFLSIASIRSREITISPFGSVVVSTNDCSISFSSATRPIAAFRSASDDITSSTSLSLSLLLDSKNDMCASLLSEKRTSSRPSYSHVNTTKTFSQPLMNAFSRQPNRCCIEKTFLSSYIRAEIEKSVNLEFVSDKSTHSKKVTCGNAPVRFCTALLRGVLSHLIREPMVSCLVF
ncbi:unnamed protein product [Albugo candida]|uniref:Uncharacterized protein n=1 Tax=Albugo candida TaxID=65357 RepID=A0A024FTL7_9STRA|nr:unnamed protein product [Albugo candida]|eukprot:CCI10463.1 unnamed protein product [Albugo candida]